MSRRFECPWCNKAAFWGSFGVHHGHGPDGGLDGVQNPPPEAETFFSIDSAISVDDGRVFGSYLLAVLQCKECENYCWMDKPPIFGNIAVGKIRKSELNPNFDGGDLAALRYFTNAAGFPWLV